MERFISSSIVNCFACYQPSALRTVLTVIERVEGEEVVGGGGSPPQTVAQAGTAEATNNTAAAVITRSDFFIAGFSLTAQMAHFQPSRLSLHNSRKNHGSPVQGSLLARRSFCGVSSTNIFASCPDIKYALLLHRH
jgi:hypothetical protein